MGKRTAIVVGATGLTGSFLVKKLCASDEYTAVSVISRRDFTYKHRKLDVKIKEFDMLEEDDFELVDDLFCCLGTTMKKAKSKENFEKVDLIYPLQIASLAKKRGIQHFHVISAGASNKKSPFFYSRVKGEMEEQLIALKLPQLSIFQPSLLTGNRGEFRLGERLAEGFFHLVNPILVGPFKRIRSISGEQLAYAMYHFAIHGKKNDVNIYKSVDILMASPLEKVEEKPVSRDEFFNWENKSDVFVKPDKKDD